ncbi:OprD family porin [Pseudomonas fontis]|uniref:OprD family porin n=1 Tax=Pseudomonas fontis TaxID=2942633 RepID=A0ABT5NWM8_9PSED|nr:OprD family porin [Pseudomonas fontis]MDD0975727.1 OprD family porin [Pseudomonas fontis]MDD0992590.1 OprD family porin [Pseudomonas fontis]
MRVMKWSMIALAVAAGTSQMAIASEQSESKGFVEDSTFKIFNRALYMNRDARNGAAFNNTKAGLRNSYFEEFGLGTRLLFSSGFTEGTVGFGVDAHTLSSTKLDSGRGRTRGADQFATNSEGRPEDTQSEMGGAIKLRLSNTVLKYGNQMTSSPVFATDDSRILPEVATGTLITSNEIEGLELSAGRFTAMNSQVQTGRDSLTQSGESLKSANIAGASYKFSENLSAAIHASDVEDFWKKQYVNVNWALPLSDEQGLVFDFNAYRSKDDGKKLAGDLDNKVWSLSAAYTLGAHTFTLGHQRSTGPTGYNYGIDGGGTVFLANSVQISDFVGPNERSWQGRYDLNMASYGVPGLSFMTRYITGDNIQLRDDEGGNKEGKEHEWNVEAKYVLQEGPAKDLSFRVRHSINRANSVENAANYNDFTDTRLIVEYPLSIL